MKSLKEEIADARFEFSAKGDEDRPDYIRLVEEVVRDLFHRHQTELKGWGRSEFWVDTAFVTSSGNAFTFTYLSCKTIRKVAADFGLKIEVMFNTDAGIKVKMTFADQQ